MSRVSKPKTSCRTCGKTGTFQIDRNSASGDLICTNCGTVQEENPIVSEIQFGETSTGAASVQGSMVRSDQARATFNGRQNAMESREQTLAKGQRNIRKIAAALKIDDTVATAAGGWFKLALTQNFVQGRRSQNVLAACLYVACRKEGTHHMLIDFSSLLQISVYSLGATFLKMVKALQIVNLPLADPSLFIQHYAERLNFGSATLKVVKDATKISRRMASDWIHQGRRPAGIAGACLLLASRMNNFRRTHAELVNVAHVGPETLQRRLNEFKKTSSGDLTVSQFLESTTNNPSLPPSYSKNRRIEEKLKLKIQEREEALERYKKMAKNKQLIPKELPEILRPPVNKEDIEEGGDKKENAGKTKKIDGKQLDDKAVAGEKQDDKTEAGDPEKENVSQEEENTDDQEKETSVDQEAVVSEAKEVMARLILHESERNKSELFVESSDNESEAEFTTPPKNFTPRRSLRSKIRASAMRPNYDEVESDDEKDDETFEEEPKATPSKTMRLSNLSEVPRKSHSPALRNAHTKTRVPVKERVKRNKTNEKINREDALLQSVLMDGVLTESDITDEIERIINKQKKSIEDSSYFTPSELQKITDVERQIEINRPRNLVRNLPTTKQLLETVKSDEVINSEDDDDEIGTVELSATEKAQKTRIWTGLNHDYIIEQEKRRLKEEADLLTGNTSATRKRRKITKQEAIDEVDAANKFTGIGGSMGLPGVDEVTGEPISAADSAKKMLAKKSFSKKINYNSLVDLFQEGL